MCAEDMKIWTLEIGYIRTREFNKTISEVRTSRTESNMDRNTEPVKELLHDIK